MAKPSAPRKPNVTATYEATLVYYDEPQLILLSTSNNKKIIAVAVVDEAAEYPFFGAEISKEQWEKYLRQINDLRYLFEYPKSNKWYVFDFANLSDANKIRMRRIDRADIPEEYIPAGQFFARSHTEPLGALESELGVEKFLIDGSWDFPDFSAFYGKISDLYALFLSIVRYGSKDTERVVRGNIRAAYRRYPLKGGASYRFFYRDLFSTQSIMDRLNVDSIQYASPGHVDVHARHDIFGEIHLSISNYKKNAHEITQSYRALRKYLSKARLLTSSAEQFDSLSPYALPIEVHTSALCRALSFPYLDQIKELTGGNILASSKIILSFTRRVDKSFRFFAEGRVAFEAGSVGQRVDLSEYEALPPELDEDDADEELEE
ncbi:hypothetical protein [Methylorubrum thiocyanatum]|uniref:hypothetical protein n=1 Tax=Methylorubrum thiocyanatum TaxID=47958 RepID=UPI00366499E3